MARMFRLISIPSSSLSPATPIARRRYQAEHPRIVVDDDREPHTTRAGPVAFSLDSFQWNIGQVVGPVPAARSEGCRHRGFLRPLRSAHDSPISSSCCGAGETTSAVHSGGSAPKASWVRFRQDGGTSPTPGTASRRRRTLSTSRRRRRSEPCSRYSPLTTYMSRPSVMASFWR